MSDVMRISNRLSMIIDDFHHRVMRIKQMGIGGVPRKQGKLSILDVEESWSPVLLSMFFHAIRGYKDPTNFASETFKLPLK